jgi:hypothetical protein
MTLNHLWLAAPHPYEAELSKPAAMTLRNTRREHLDVAAKAKKDSVWLLRMGDSGSAAPSDFPPAVSQFVVGVRFLPIVEPGLNDARSGAAWASAVFKFPRGRSVVGGIERWWRPYWELLLEATLRSRVVLIKFADAREEPR